MRSLECGDRVYLSAKDLAISWLAIVVRNYMLDVGHGTSAFVDYFLNSHPKP